MEPPLRVLVSEGLKPRFEEQFLHGLVHITKSSQELLPIQAHTHRSISWYRNTHARELLSYLVTVHGDSSVLRTSWRQIVGVLFEIFTPTPTHTDTHRYTHTQLQSVHVFNTSSSQ